jgi:phosphoribosylformylglycinamidine synthase
MQGLIESAHDLSEGGLAIAIIEASLRFNVGCRIWLGELMERDSIDATAALFSESQSRVIVSVGREDDVKFQSLCEARGVSVLRIGVTDKESAAVDIQSIAKLTLADIRKAWSATIPQVVQ